MMLAALLGACGSAPGGGAGSGKGGEGSVASLASTPSPEAFYLGRGDTESLSVTVTRKSSEVSRLELKAEVGPLGVNVSPASHSAEFEEGGPDSVTVVFTVSVEPAIVNEKPDFYIYGKALNERGKSLGSETLRLKYQWPL